MDTAVADQGDADGQIRYAASLRDGDGVEKDVSAAVQFFKMAADQGKAQGQANYQRLTGRGG